MSNMKVEQDKSKYAQCNLCLGEVNVYKVQGDNPIIINICNNCLKEIQDNVTKNKITNIFNDSVNNREVWTPCSTDIDFSGLTPLTISNSLHIYEERYIMTSGDEYKVSYQIGNDKPFLVEKLEK